MYSVNWQKFIKSLLKARLIKPFVLAFLEAFTAPIVRIHAEFLLEKKEWDYVLNHDGRVFSLESVLNDKFDNEERRIYISDVDFQDSAYIGNRDNVEQVYISTSGDPKTLHISNAPQYMQNSNFIVHAPTDILSENEILIRNAIEKYKIAGKTYILIPI